MTRRNPSASRPRRVGRGPLHAEAIAWRRDVLAAARGCPPGTEPEEVRALARTGGWWMGVDPRRASDAYVAAAFLLGVTRGAAAGAWRVRPDAETAALERLAGPGGVGGGAC